MEKCIPFISKMPPMSHCELKPCALVHVLKFWARRVSSGTHFQGSREKIRLLSPQMNPKANLSAVFGS